MKVGEPESADPADQDHWRARRLRKNIEKRRRQRAKGELLPVDGGENGGANKKHARDATSLRALQVKLYVL